MKTQIKIGWILLAAMLPLAGCVKDAPAPEPAPGAEKSITFSLPGKPAPKTYVDAEQGEEDIDNLAIYMFDVTSTKLENMYTGTAAGYKEEGGQRTATIDVSERTGSKVFFFVGNADGVVADLAKVRFNETTIAEFQEILTDNLTGLPVKPMLMTAKQPVADVESVDEAEKKVLLQRRVTRFDIENDAAVTNFTIKKILLNNINKQGYLFGAATGAGPTLATGSKEVEFGTGTGHNAGEVKSVFYTYPATIAAGQAGISIEGEFRTGAAAYTRVYTFKPDADFEIKPNTRYILKAEPVDEQEIKFTITVAEWVDGGDVELETELDRIEVTPLTVRIGDGVLSNGNKDYDVYNSINAEGSVLIVDVKSYRGVGTRAEIEYVKGSSADLDIQINDPDPVLTYSAAYYAQQYEITIPKMAKRNDEDVEAIIRIISESNPSKRELFRITSTTLYPASADPALNHKPVRVGGVLWAPVNVGAKNIAQGNFHATNPSTDDTGLYFQWGRGLASGLPYAQVAGDAVDGPMNLTNANNATNIKKFIKPTIPPTPAYATTGDWVNPQTPGLWQDNTQGPCPHGWRIPTKAEYEKIVALYNKKDGSTVFANNNWGVQGDDPTETLYFPLAGQRDYALGAPGSINFSGFYRNQDQKSFSGNNAVAISNSFIISSSSISVVSQYYNAHAQSVRCVADE